MVSGPVVVMFRDTLRMWYQGSSAPELTGVVHLGYAWSMDGVSWHRRSAPVLSAGTLGWDYPHLMAPNVLVDGDTLRMWYGGGTATSTGMQIGYAVSVDGINWERYPAPVMAGNQPWNSDGVLPGGVINDGREFRMWFSGGIGQVGVPTASSSWSIGLATSPDGIHWTMATSPVITHGIVNEADQDMALAGTVRQTSSGYELWYAGLRREGFAFGSIMYATSPDGITWTKRGVVLRGGSAPGLGDSFYAPHLIFETGLFRMWFGAWHPGPTIGYATSQQ